jgi:mono/diheme cytochrome c family protein
VRFVICFFAALAMVGAALAQPPSSGDNIASFTAAQAASGHTEYAASCMDCHGQNLNDGEFGGPPLKGAAFRAKWLKLPASGLVGYMHGAMPPDSPGRLPLGTYAEIAAYILSMNGIAPSSRELPADMAQLGKLHFADAPAP